MEITRIKNTLRNFLWGLLNKITTIIFPFVIRTVIIYVLGVKYAGLNGLFTAVLSVLSLAELVFVSVLSYSMYKPVAENDKNKICSLLSLYKKLYLIIGGIVLFIGLCLLPFIPILVNDSIPDELDIYFLYLIYLSESVCSYFVFAYRSSLFNAYHRKHIISNISTVVNLCVYIVQIAAIVFFKNYYVYLVLRPISIILINIITSIWAKHDYPDIKCGGELEKNEIRKIKKEVCGLMCQRLAFKSRNAFDSIVISSVLGLTIVGIYSNYFYIIGAVDLVLELIFQSMQSGIGNSIVCEDLEKNHRDFKKINFLYMWISSVCTVCIFVLIQDFMSIWVGKDLMFSVWYVVLFCLLFWSTRITDTVGAYISATGTWWFCKHIYIIEAIMNLVLNIILGFFYGVPGVVIASIVTVLLINFPLCGRLLYKRYFVGYKFNDLLIVNCKFFIVTFFSCFVSYTLTLIFPEMESKVSFLLVLVSKAIICFIITNFVFYIFLKKDDSYKESSEWIKSFFKRKGVAKKKRIIVLYC